MAGLTRWLSNIMRTSCEHHAAIFLIWHSSSSSRTHYQVDSAVREATSQRASEPDTRLARCSSRVCINQPPVGRRLVSDQQVLLTQPKEAKDAPDVAVTRQAVRIRNGVAFASVQFLGVMVKRTG